MPHVFRLTDSVTRISRQLVWPLAASLTLHVAAFYGWHSPLLYTQIGHDPEVLHARLTRAAVTDSTVLPEPVEPPPESAKPDLPASPEPPTPRTEAAPEDADPSTYPSAGALDAPAVPVTSIDPQYPDDPQLQQLEGRIVLRVLINEHGAVDRVIVEDAGSLPSSFEDSAATAFLAARFQPALKGGVPVKSQILIEVRFDHAR